MIGRILDAILWVIVTLLSPRTGLNEIHKELDNEYNT
jgi:hypothetical protein